MSSPIATNTRSISAAPSTPRALARRLLGPAAPPLLTLLALGCASDGVDLGGGVATQRLRRGARCEASTSLLESVRVTSQQELAELEGCEHVAGHLTIQIFAGADLAPLSALRAVDGGLVLGDSRTGGLSEEELGDSELVEEILLAEEPLRGTWLASLAGLESLERVGALALMYTAIPDVLPLAKLRQIGAMAAAQESFLGTNELVIQGNPALRDLTGLDGAHGVTHLSIGFNGALESLTGLTLGSQLTQIGVFEEPSLTDIEALSTVSALGSLTLNQVGVVDLDALSSLRRVDGAVTIEENPDLVDASGLGGLREARAINLINNASLQGLPSLQRHFTPPDSIVIFGNPEIEELTFDFPQASTAGFFVAGEILSTSIDGIQIGNNEKLQTVVFPPGEIEQLGLSSVQILAFELNPSLTFIDLGGLSRADVLLIDQNPVLTDVALGKLSTVESLEITNNPSLDASVFDSVRTFERVESGNAP